MGAFVAAASLTIWMICESVLADARRAAFQKARLIHRCRGNGITRRLVDRNAFARQSGLVDGACAFQHHAVDRNAFARADDEHVVLLHLLDGDERFFAVAQERRRFRRELHQPLECVSRAPFRACLKRFADGDQRQNHCGGFEVKVHHIAHDGLRVAAYLRARHGEKRVRAVNERRRSAERDEGIHVRRAMPQALETADEKFLIDYHHDGREQQLRQPHGDVIVRVKRG